MFKKIICTVLSALLLAGCAHSASDSAFESSELKTLSEIRAEAENISELAAEFDNLDLSETYFYVPDVDEMGGFTVDYTAPFEEKERLLFDTAEWLTGEAPAESDITFFSRDYQTIPYAEHKNDPQREYNYSIDYETDSLHLKIEWRCNIVFIFKDYDNVPISDFGSYLRLDDLQEYPVAEYDLRAGESAGAIFELQGGEISVEDAVELMKSELEASPFRIDGLELIPCRARVNKLSEKYAVSAMFLQGYNGVIVDYHDYLIDPETDEYDFIRDGMSVESAMARNDRIDQLHFTRIGTLTPTDDRFNEFISLERFLSMISEKLTGRGRKFKVDSVELLYGVNTLYPEEYGSSSGKDLIDVFPLGIKSRPMWVAYLSRTGIHGAEQMCVSADAVTGELKLHESFVW